MAQNQVSQAQFLGRVRDKYPEYESVADSTLLDAMLEKYPEYKETIDFSIPMADNDPQQSFESAGDDYDYKTATDNGLQVDATGHWPSRVPETGQILKGEGHPTFNQTLDEERRIGNVVYRGDDGLIYSHPKHVIDVTPESILSSELKYANSSGEKINESMGGLNTSKKEIVSTDYGIPQINNFIWEDAFKEQYGKGLADSLPEEQIEFGINRILLNEKGDSPDKIQNWSAYTNGSYAKYKDWTNEQYEAVLGANPEHLALIDSLAGAEASTIKAVFAAESDYDPTKTNNNYRSVKKEIEESAPTPTLNLPKSNLLIDEQVPETSISQAPEKSFISKMGDRLTSAWQNRDLTFQDPSQAAMAGRAQADFLATDRLKQLSKENNVFLHPNSPEWESEVKEQVAWEVMSEPKLFMGEQESALGKSFQQAQKKAKDKERASGSPRERYKKELAKFDIGTGPSFLRGEDFASLAWSNSLTGLGFKLAGGDDVDLTFYEPSDHEQMAAGIVGLMMPLDALSFGVGGLLGKAGMSAAKITNLTRTTLNATSGKLARARMIKNGVDPVMASRAVSIATAKTANRMATFGGALGTYEGLGSAFRQLDEKGFIDPVTWTKDVIAHTALGMVTGSLAELGAAVPRMVKPLATGRGAKLTQQGLGFVGEVAGFGGFSPLLVEGRKPTGKDFTEAATFLLGIKLASPLQQVYGQATSKLINKTIAFKIKREYAKGKSFEQAQEIVYNEVKSAVDIAMEKEFGQLPSDGSPQGMGGRGKAHILGENKDLPVDQNGIAIILDANGNRIPFKPLLSQRELVLTGEQRNADGEVIAVGRGQVPEKAPGETKVPGQVVDTKKVMEPVLDKEGNPVLDKEGNVVTKEVTQEIREQVPISEAVAEQLDLPNYLKKGSIESLPNDILEVRLSDKDISPREAQAIRFEQERRKLEAVEDVASQEKDVSSLVQERGNLQLEQNKLFQELKLLREGTPEYNAKEKQIVEMGDRMQELDGEIANRAVRVPVGKKGEKGLGLKGQDLLPGEAEVPVGGTGEGGVMRVPVGGSELRKPPVSPEQAKAADLMSRGEAPVVEPAKEPAKADTGKAYEYDKGEYLLGPVESETGTKFGVFPKADPRGGPVVTFESRDKAIEWMDGQVSPAKKVKPVPKAPSEPKFEDITGSKGNKLGEINMLQEGEKFGNYGIRKDVKSGKEVYKIAINRTDTGLRAQVQTVEGEFFGSYKEAFNKLADRIARKDVNLDRSTLSKELQAAIIEVEKTFDNKTIKDNTKSDLLNLSKKDLINLLDETVHQGRYMSISSLPKPQIVDALKRWQAQGDAARGVEKTTTTVTKEPKPLKDKEKETLEEELLGEFGYERGELVSEERLLEQPADFEKASQLLSLGEPAYYAEKPLTETVVAWSDGVRLGEFKSKSEAHKVLNKYVKKHFKGISDIVSPDTPAPLYKKGEKVKLEKLMGKRYGEEGENLEVLSFLRVGNEWKYNVKGKDGQEFWTNEPAIISRPANSTKPVSEKMAKAKLSGSKQRVKIIEDAERGEVREDAPKAIQEMVLQKAEIEKKLQAELNKGEKADADKVMGLQLDKADLTTMIGDAKIGKPRDGDQVTLTPTSKPIKGKKKVVKKPAKDTSGKIEIQKIFESIKEQIEMQGAGSGAKTINYKLVKAPENSRIIERKNGDNVLEINLPQVNGSYEVVLPKEVRFGDGKVGKSQASNTYEFFRQFSKAAIAKKFSEPKIGLTGGGRRVVTEANAPEFTAPDRKSLSQIDKKGLEKALKGYEARLSKYQNFKGKTTETELSVGELKEAIRIAKDLIKTQKEADRLGGTIAGVDFIPGTTALFSAMRKWKRSKLPLTDRDKLDNLAKRSNKLYNEWNAGGKVDKEMEGRLEALSSEMTKLENTVKNQIPTEKEMVQISEDIKWPTRTADLRRTHQTQRALVDKMKTNQMEVVDPDFRDLKLQVTKGRSNSQKDFTQEEMIHYEQVLNEMNRTGGYLDELPAMHIEAPFKKSRFVNSLFSSKHSRLKNMGNAGTKLAQKAVEFVRNQTNITGAGENAVNKIKDLVGKKNLKYFVAAIDPYLAKGVDFKGLKGGEEAFLNNPKTKQAAKIWKEYTDYLHKLRGEYDTYVEFVVDGKKERVKADDVYLDNWIRYQLKEDVVKDFSLMGEGFYKEVNSLINSGKAKTFEEAQAIIGEWTRTSPFYKGPVRYGSADRLRTQLLSPDLYETDFTNLAPGITRKYATFLAGAEAFGQDMSIRNTLIGQIYTEAGARKAKEASDLMERIIDGESENSHWFLNTTTRGFSALHLTSPQTGKNNLFYSFITDLPTYGVRNVSKGIFGFFNNIYGSMELTRRVGQLGVGTREIKSITFEKGAAELVTAIGLIKQSEFLNRAKSVISAGATGQTYIDYMSGKLSAEHINFFGKKKLERGRNFFKEFGGFSDAAIDKMVKRGYMKEKEVELLQSLAPSMTQGSTHPLFMPDIMSGRMEFAGSLYKMAYRATAGLHKAVIKPALKGDMVPLAKWAAGGALAGELQYYINYALFGWEHPSGGNLDDFIEYMHGKDAPTEKIKAAMLRAGRNLVRAQSFGIFSDAFQGYGMYPIVVDAYENFYKELTYVLTGKKTKVDAGKDFATAHVAVYRDWMKLQKSRFSPRSKEYRTYGNVRKYVSEFDKKRKGRKPQSDYRLSDNTTSSRAIRDAFWEADAKEMKRVMKSAVKTMTQKAVAADAGEDIMTGKTSRLEKMYTEKARTNAKGVIRRMHPLNNLAGKLKVNVDGKSYMVKDGGKETDATIFWEGLTSPQKQTVLNSVKDYYKIIKELKLDFIIE